MLPNRRKIVILIMTLTILVLGLMLLLYYNKNKNTKIYKTTQYFNQASSNIPDKREYPINNSVNPCTNFYEYACSNVINNFKLREDRSVHIFSYDDAKERLLEEKKRYFLELANKTPGSEMEGEIKNYYIACMDKTSRKKEELSLIEETKKILNNIKTKKEFLGFIADNITNPSQLSFINFDAKEPNLDRPNYYDLFFDTQLMNLPEKSYYKDPEIVQALNKLVQQFFISIGEKSAEQKAKYVVNFEKELAKVYPSPLEFRKRIYYRTQISREILIKDYPYLKLEKFLNIIPRHVVIRNIIGNRTMGFLNKKLKTSSLEELKSIYMYFQLSPFIYDTYPEFFIGKNNFYSKYLGRPNQMAESRQEFCAKMVMRHFEKEVDFILLPKLFPNFPREKFIKLFKKVRDVLIEQLETNTWLDTNTKQEAIRKIKNAKLQLVSPNNEEEWNFNPRTSYSTNTPLANRQKYLKLKMDKDLKELIGPINICRWRVGPLTVNAFYNDAYNQLVFPIGILQYPFYDPAESETVNLGGVGSVIGHELGHAIDNRGSEVDADGVLKKWMSPKDKKIFNNKTQFLIDQFNKIGHNGELTLPENISDLVGLGVAYKAAFPNTSNDKELKRNFFLQFARKSCEVQREEYAKLRLKTNPHSLGQAIVNEQLKHQVDFKEAYNCKVGDPMVIPEDEIVKVW